jgi:ubiquinone/menaquinone biosynthesis C-methylase UbiE
MSDVWSRVQELEPSAQERLAAVLETRGADPRQQAMRREFLATIPFPATSSVLEVGCGTGVLCRVLATWPGADTVTGLDPAPSLIARARDLTSDIANLRFIVGDGCNLPFDEASFDVVVFDSTLCHIPTPDAALREAFRVLRAGGTIAAFDGDYATTTVSLGANDPLQVCVDAMMASSVTDRWLVRRLPAMVRDAGFEAADISSYSYVETVSPDYMLSVVDRGADILVSNLLLSPATADQLKREARTRVESGTFFGHITYESIVARRPGPS